jgi:hypothetical protein
LGATLAGAFAGSGLGKDTAATPIIVCLLLAPYVAGGWPDAGKLDTIGGLLGLAEDAGGASAVGLANPNMVACEAFAIDGAIAGAASGAKTAPQRLQKRPSGGNG